MKKEVSVIVPIYNAHKYLKRCIRSILDQTYENLDIVLIDDGSQDNSLEICKRFEKEDQRVRVFHKENGGVSSARNYGIKKAQGEYIVFIDADDRVETSFIESLLAKAKENSIVICSFVYGDEGGNISASCEMLEDSNLNDLNDFITSVVVERKIFGSVCRTLFPSKIIMDNNIEFVDCVLAEDQLFLLTVVSYCSTIITLKKAMYVYFDNSSSATHEVYRKNFLKDRERYCAELQRVIDRYPLSQENKKAIFQTALLRERKNVFFNLVASDDYSVEYKQFKTSRLFDEQIGFRKKMSWLKTLSKSDLIVVMCMDFHLVKTLRFIRQMRKKVRK